MSHVAGSSCGALAAGAGGVVPAGASTGGASALGAGGAGLLDALGAEVGPAPAHIAAVRSIVWAASPSHRLSGPATRDEQATSAAVATRPADTSTIPIIGVDTGEAYTARRQGTHSMWHRRCSVKKRFVDSRLFLAFFRDQV